MKYTKRRLDDPRYGPWLGAAVGHAQQRAAGRARDGRHEPRAVASSRRRLVYPINDSPYKLWYGCKRSLGV